MQPWVEVAVQTNVQLMVLRPVILRNPRLVLRGIYSFNIVTVFSIFNA